MIHVNYQYSAKYSYRTNTLYTHYYTPGKSLPHSSDSTIRQVSTDEIVVIFDCVVTGHVLRGRWIFFF